MNNKINKINIALIKKEKFLVYGAPLILLSLVFSYLFLMFVSVSTIYAVENENSKLSLFVSNNSELEQDFFKKQRSAMERFSNKLVYSDNISYVDGSKQRLVMNR